MMTTTGEKVLARLQAHEIKQEGAGKYRLNSPLRPGSNSHAFSLRIDADGEHGAYQDFASEEKGSLYDLAMLLGIDLPERTGVASTKRAYATMAEYAQAHGLTAEALEAAGWKQVTRQSRPALEFPTRTGTRWRFIDGAKPYYKSGDGYKKCWYGVERALSMIDAQTPLVICNGEISTIAGQQHKIAATCVTSGEGQIPNELIAELVAKLWAAPSETTVIIALDCDKKGIESAQRVETQFKAHGFNARAVDLLLGDHGDLADFCMLHGEAAPQALLKLPALPHDVDTDDEDEFHIYDISELDQIPPLRWIIEGEIPECGFVMIFGESNVGKSFIAVDYAMRIAEKHNVLYVACEGESGLPLRIDGWLVHHRRRRRDFKFKMMVGFVDFFEKDNLQRFSDFVAPHNPYVIVVDTLGLIMGAGDENSARDVLIVLKGSRRLQKRFGCTLIFIHHTNKGGIQERGSGQLRGRMDTVIQVLPDDDRIRVESSKTRDTKKFEPKSLRLLPVIVPDKGETLVPVLAADEPGDEQEVTPDQRKVLEVMAMSIYQDGISQRDLAEIARLTYGRCVKALGNLADKGLVDKPRSKREHCRINNAGREAIGLPPVAEYDDANDDEEDYPQPREAASRVDRNDDSLDRSHASRVDPKGRKNSSRVDRGASRVDRLDRKKTVDRAEVGNSESGDPHDPVDPIDPHGETATPKTIHTGRTDSGGDPHGKTAPDPEPQTGETLFPLSDIPSNDTYYARRS